MKPIRVRKADIEVEMYETRVRMKPIGQLRLDGFHSEGDDENFVSAYSSFLITFSLSRFNDLTNDKKQEAKKIIVSTRNGCIQAFLNRHVRRINPDAYYKWIFRTVK